MTTNNNNNGDESSRVENAIRKVQPPENIGIMGLIAWVIYVFRLPIVAVTLGYIVAVVFGWMPSPLSLVGGVNSRPLKVFLLAVPIVFIGFLLPVYAIVKSMANPPRTVVIKVNLTHAIPVRIRHAHPDNWDSVSMETGSPFEFTIGNTVCRIVTNFGQIRDYDESDEFYEHISNPEDRHSREWVAGGSWLGEASDAEIVNAREEIEANRRRNNTRAQVGEKAIAKLQSVADKVESEHHHRMLGKARETLFDEGEAIDSVLADEIPEYEGNGSPLDAIDEEIAWQIEAMNTEGDGVTPGGSDE